MISFLPSDVDGRFFGPSEGESEDLARPSTVVTEEKQNPFSLSLVPSSQIHSVLFYEGLQRRRYALQLSQADKHAAFISPGRLDLTQNTYNGLDCFFR